MLPLFIFGALSILATVLLINHLSKPTFPPPTLPEPPEDPLPEPKQEYVITEVTPAEDLPKKKTTKKKKKKI